MRKRADAGFTLLELLVAIGLLSLITGSILGGLHLGRRVWENGRAREASSEIEGAARALSELIGHAFPATLVVADRPVIAFAGDAETCRFVALSEGWSQWGGLILTEIGAAPGRNRSELTVWTQVFRPGPVQPGRAAMRATQALSDIAFIELAYFGSEDGETPPAWVKSWKNTQTLPQLVAVRLGANRFGRLIETSFIVALNQR